MLKFNFSDPKLAKALLFIALILSFICSIIIGPLQIDLKSIFSYFINQGTLSDIQLYTLLEIRFPRALACVFVGSILAICGASMQALFRNPLADPGLIGVTAGASFGAAFYIKFGLLLTAALPTFIQNFGLPLSAFGAGLIVTWLIQKAAFLHGKSHVSIMLLAGIAINALSGAGIGIILFFSDDDMLRQFTFWTLGNVGHADWTKLAVALPMILVSMVLILRNTSVLNLLLLGETECLHLGINVPKLNRILILSTAAGVGAAVSVTGAIGFIGLVVPHIIRQWIGPDHSNLVVCSAFLGATLLLIADILAKNIAPPAELPIGTLTALMGAPVFFAILLKQRRFVD